MLQTVDVAGFWRFGICDAVSIFLPAVSRLFPIFPVYVALFFWFISSRIILGSPAASASERPRPPLDDVVVWHE
ncbi:hypothetical protein [Cardiobacterium hominis]|uniref:hypothetical protein n=1 Tax=Cardiobacterium hominis TaxID=2718 RepID=UPI0018721C2D|nr:hypothetical protein [Cardiobacterium hominis]